MSAVGLTYLLSVGERSFTDKCLSTRALVQFSCAVDSRHGSTLSIARSAEILHPVE